MRSFFLSYVLKALTRCEDRFTFVENINQYIEKYRYVGSRTNENQDSYLGVIRPKSLKFCINISDTYPYTVDAGHFSVMDEVGLEFKRETSWLYTDDRYAHLRELALQDKIVLITESICETSTFSAICKILRDNMVPIDTVYISNIAEWMLSPDERDSFINTIRQFLFNQQTIVIDAYRDGNESLATQRCILARDLKNEDLQKRFFPSNDLSEEESLTEPESHWSCCIS